MPVVCAGQEVPWFGDVPGRTYQLIVAGELSDQLGAFFNGMTLTRTGGTATLSGYVRDQAELQGLLQRVSDLGLTLLEVKAGEEDAKRSGRARAEIR